MDPDQTRRWTVVCRAWSVPKLLQRLSAEELTNEVQGSVILRPKF